MTARRTKPLSASEVVREAIRTSGLSIRELARRTGVEVSALSRFMNEMVGISLSTFEKLAPELGLRVVREAPVEAVPPHPTGKQGKEGPGSEARRHRPRTRTSGCPANGS
jgi:transcriptional regulator with XRE-family HTH domain